MPESERTPYSVPIPLRDKGIEGYSAAHPNPYTRLEGVAGVREQLQWLAELLGETDGTVSADDLADVLRDLRQALQDCLWGDATAVDQARRQPRFALVAVWRDQLGLDPI